METNKTDPSTERNSGQRAYDIFWAAVVETYREKIESKIEELETEIDHHRRHAFDPETGEYHQAEIVRLKNHPMLKEAQRQRVEALSQKYSEAVLRRWQ